MVPLNLEDLLGMRRVTGLVLSPDGDRLVASVQQLDDEGVTYVSALWEVDPTGAAEARRLTWSRAGESAPAFAADGSLLFTSTRPDPVHAGDGGDDKPALWRLPRAGEAHPLASSPGGLAGPVAAASAPVFVAATDRLPGSSADEDEEWRTARTKRKVTAVIHDRFPIRYWDHELGPDLPRLLTGTLTDQHTGAAPAQDGRGGSLPDLTPDPGAALVNAVYDITPDGATVVSDWYVAEPGGHLHCQLVAADVATGRRRVLVHEPGVDTHGPRVSPDGRTVAFRRHWDGDHDTPTTEDVGVVDLDGTGPARLLSVGEDLSPGPMAWSPDSRVLYVCGDRGGRGTVLAVDVDQTADPAGWARRHLATDAVYTFPCPSPDGRYLYALRSAVDCPPTPVRLDTTLTGQEPVFLPSPAPRPELPGTLTQVSATAPDGATVWAWLVTPAEPAGGGPAPLQLWIHGGPFASTNSWSYRWCPWVAAARGWAVLMPDPALSTGYGSAWLARGWPHRAATVWSDLRAVLDSVLERDDIDAGRTACLGGSFGGYMTNWVAGHTDRFRAFVTHAGLWAADQQHATTDAANWKASLFGTPAEHPDWYAENSPNNFVDAIGTPMLVIHGNRDYRVPYSEALRLWWDLASRHTGDPDDFPHRFLQFPTENHWILSPAHSRIWYETVLAFLDWHVLDGQWQPPELC